jgi:hypothetical protein
MTQAMLADNSVLSAVMVPTAADDHLLLERLRRSFVTGMMDKPNACVKVVSTSQTWLHSCRFRLQSRGGVPWFSWHALLA